MRNCSLWLVLLLCCWGMSSLPAQITISGTVTVGADADIIVDHPITLTGLNGITATTVTDTDGSYSFSFDFTGTNSGAVVSTFDICTGEVLEEAIILTPNQVSYIVDFSLCSNIDPPDNDTCAAFFYAEQVQVDDGGYYVNFFNLSVVTTAVAFFEWNFGDGETSTEYSPVHEYDGPGTYTVTLTVTSSSGCTDTYSAEVVVVEENDCDCPEDIYNPVCVITASGAILSFVNTCYAECAGYGPDQYFACDGDCDCPAIYDPVCVDTNTGTLTFSNACEAECQGFTEADWYECGDCQCDQGNDPVCLSTPYGEISFPNICIAQQFGFTNSQIVDCEEECICPDVYDPVCVATPSGIILEFSNACEAECEGFGPDVYTSCEPNGCDCPEYLAPVCIIDPNGNELYFDNPCFAVCAGFNNPNIWTSCNNECICPDVYGPVCVETGAGVVTFGNACEAACFSFTEEDFISCDNDCACDDYFLPVCIETANGELLTFDNPCFAVCAGYDDPFAWSVCNGDCICPDVYDPVCVETGAGIVTFGNACEAACFLYGEDDFVSCDDSCVCPDIYAPVCVVTPNGDVITFSNPCYAECEGYSVDDYVACVDNCGCPDVFDPVCVEVIGTIVQYGNACEAECAGFTAEDFVECDNTNNCDCYDVYDPVCVETPNAPTQTFPNACYAECAGYTADQYTDCDGCACDTVYDPVCVAGIAGPITFGNACEAECAGFTPDLFIDCESGCNCPTIYDPVCVIGPDGTITTFSNACEAECAGFTPDQFVDCDNDCVCPTIYDPVCVQLPGLDIIFTFNNACEAECAGFTPDQFVDCDGSLCDCPDLGGEPICVATGGQIIQFDNACQAICAGYDDTSVWTNCNGDVCDCSAVFGPAVCVNTPVGTIEFQTYCHAECFGFTDYVDCESDCDNCTTEYDPVCVQITPLGPITIFDNACLALCAGFTEDQFVDCNPTDCLCPAVYDPVCIETDCGEITFPNACVAECYGFGPDLYVDCDGIDPGCHADFTTIQNNSSPLTVTFQDASITTSPIIEWYWDFGDGTTGEGPVVDHTFPSAGIYDVTLTIVTGNCEASVTHHICINGDGGVDGDECQAMFFFEQSDANDLFTFDFTDMSLGDIDIWTWDFGDGQSSNEQNPSHTYETEGVYIVTLTVSTEDCESSASMILVTGDDIIYEDDCQALFLPIINPDAPEVFFLNLSSPNAITFDWDYGDGTTESGSFFAYHEYAEAGVYTVTLTITTADGCTSTFSVTLDLSENNFTAEPEYSFTTDVSEDTPATIDVRLAPNPSRSETWLYYQALETADYQIEIVNPNGQLLGQWKQVAQPGENRLRLDISSYPAGLYFVRLRQGNLQQMLRMVKIQ